MISETHTKFGIKIFLVLIFGLVIIQNSCRIKPEDEALRPIAQVKNFTITSKDFIDQFEKTQPNIKFNDADSSLKRKVLDDMIEQQILLMEAYRLKYDKEKEAVQLFETKERELAANALVKQVAARKAVTDASLRTFYQWLDKDFEFYFIQLNTGLFDEEKETAKQKADDLYLKLQNGANFKVLAAEYSDYSTAKFDSGKMYRMTCFDVDEEITRQAYNINEGDISTPFYTDNSYYIVKLEKIHHKNIGNFEAEKEYLIEDLDRYYENKNIFKKEQLNRYVRKKYHYQKLSENIDLFCERTKKMTTKVDTTNLFTKKEKQIPLSKTDVEEITIGQFLPKVLEYYWDSLFQQRVVLMLLKYMNTKRLIKHEAMQRKLNELPEVKKNLILWRISYLKHQVVQKQVIDKIDVSEKILEPIYEREKHNFKIEKRITVREIFCITEDQIDKVYNLAIGDSNFEMLEEKYNQNQETRTHGLLGPFTKGRHGILGETVFSGMKVGDISKPFRYRGGYSFFKVVAIEQPRVKTYQEVQEELANKYKEENKDRFLYNWLQKAKANYNIKIFELP